MVSIWSPGLNIGIGLTSLQLFISSDYWQGRRKGQSQLEDLSCWLPYNSNTDLSFMCYMFPVGFILQKSARKKNFVT